MLFIYVLVMSARTEWEIHVFSFELSVILLVVQNLVYTPTIVIDTGELAPPTLKWVIISTGDISTNFAHHLPIDPTSRSTRDVNHKDAAVGSLSVQFAQTFIHKLRKL